MALYAYFIQPARPDFAPDNASEAEMKSVGEHWNYLVSLNEAGKVRFVGRTNTPPFVGMGVFEVADAEEAEAIAAADPAVREGVFVARVQPYSIFFQNLG